jgi:hypothetical protein
MRFYDYSTHALRELDSAGKLMEVHHEIVDHPYTRRGSVGTPSMAMDVSSLPMTQSEKDRQGASTATSSVPLYALSRLDARTLAEKEMMDQELKAVEGGYYMFRQGWPMKYDGVAYEIRHGWN